MEAAKNLYKHLHHGFTGKGVHRVPIAGDTTRLPHATGLSPLEKRLAHAQHFLAKHLPGSQQLRQLMGHTQFGARVNYGDCLFFTISPNEQHSALVLLLSRFRSNDPYVKHQEEDASRLAGQDHPKLEAKRRVEIPFPEYDLRRAATARDPLAVVEGYKVEVLLRLAGVLGLVSDKQAVFDPCAFFQLPPISLNSFVDASCNESFCIISHPSINAVEMRSSRVHGLGAVSTR
jgi:hypothetical protein